MTKKQIFRLEAALERIDTRLLALLESRDDLDDAALDRVGRLAAARVATERLLSTARAQAL